MDDREPMLEDDHDLLNDETFGGEGGEFNWDEAGPPEDLFDFTQNNAAQFEEGGHHARTSPLQMNEAVVFSDYEDPDVEFMNVEESISRLVLDDEDIENERDRFIKASHKSMMPPQVITRNLNWLTEKDMGSPLFSSSVWSMHPTDVLQGNADVAQPRPVLTQQPSNRPPPGLSPRPSQSSFRTLTEVEDELHLSSATISFLQTVTNPVDPYDPLALKNPQGCSILPLTRTLSQIPDNQLPMVRRRLEEERAKNFPPGHPGPGRGVQRYPPPPGAMGFRGGNRPFMPPGMRPRLPPNMPGFYPGQQQFQQPPPLCDWRNGGPGFFPLPPSAARLPLNPTLNTRHPPAGYNGEGHGGDRYAGIMTDREKQRLRNIQMLQLQNDHPYTTDFYYQMKKFQTDGNVGHLKKAFPSASDCPTRAPYQPTRFENALGQLHAVSALAPKRIIDTVLQVPFTSIHGRKSRARVLRGIEEVYRLYLDIKEFKYRKTANTLDEEHDSMAEFSAYAKILRALDEQGDLLSGWMLRQKGRELLNKLIMEFFVYEKGRNAAFMILTNMLKHSTFTSMKRFESDQLCTSYLPDLGDVIREATVFTTDLLLQGLDNETFKTSFGCSLFLMILERAAYFVLRREAPISWSTFEHPLDPSTFESPTLNLHDHDELTGFTRLPSLIKWFLDYDLEDLGMPRGHHGKAVELLMLRSRNQCVFDAVERWRQVFRHI